MITLVIFAVWLGVASVQLFVAGYRSNGSQKVGDTIAYAMSWPVILWVFTITYVITFPFKLGKLLRRYKESK